MVKAKQEDKTFMEIVEKGTSKKDDHYVVPLPFRNPNLMLPNNKKQAIQRLMGLKRRFMKDKKFFQDYLNFMDNLLRSGYAKRSDASPSGKTYISRHGVCHPSKPDEIRVVFDCSAEYQGRSINKELLSGPDLTNQIIGVLTKFREQKIAFKADVEAMYHQVQVPEDEQSFLKFLRMMIWTGSHMIMQCVHTFLAQHRQPAVQIMLCIGQPWKMKQSLEKQQQVLFITTFM